MLLKYIYLYLKPEEFSRAYRSLFDFRTRHICNFLERKLKAVKFQAENFSRICIEGTTARPAQCTVRGEHALVVPVSFNPQRYDALAQEECPEFFLEMLCDGFRKCSPQFKIPLTELMQGIEEFRQGGYKNEWTHKSKLLRPTGIRAALLCRLDIERFVLTLQLECEGEIVFKEPILETKPDETCFAYKFKDVVLVDNTIVVTDTFGDPTFSLSLNSLNSLDKPQIH